MRAFWKNIIWLVVSTPLKNDGVSWDDDIPNIWKVIKFHGSSHHQPVIFKTPSNNSGSGAAGSHMLYGRRISEIQPTCGDVMGASGDPMIWKEPLTSPGNKQYI